MVAFDRLRVERALSDEDLSGRDYLDKILQVTTDLPPIPHELLARQVLNSIEESLTGISNSGPYTGQLWPDVFAEIVRPLIQTPRDVRRYAVAVRSAVLTLNGQVELTDVLALEAIRIFLPDVFSRMHAAAKSLTTTADSARYEGERVELKGVIDSLLGAAGEQQGVLRAMITRLFPASRWHIENYHFGGEFKKTWLSERRVAHEDVLRLYLERTPNAAFKAFTDAEQAFALMGDQDDFSAFLRSLEAQRLQDVIAALETFEQKFAPDQVVPGTIVLTNLLRELPERQRGMFELDANIVVGRVLLRLLRSLPDQGKIETAISEVLPQVTSLRGKLRVIDLVGHRENVGHKLVSFGEAEKLARDWRIAARAASSDALLNEGDLLFMLLWAKRDVEPDEAAIVIPDSPQMTLKLLREARTEMLSNSIGSRAIQRHPRLEWDALSEVFGSEDVLKQRIDRLRASALEIDSDLMEFADKYLAGWRPDRLAQHT